MSNKELAALGWTALVLAASAFGGVCGLFIVLGIGVPV